MRFAPTNAASASHHELMKIGLPGTPSASDRRIIVPANMWTICQDVMTWLLVFGQSAGLTPSARPLMRHDLYIFAF
jgi:hypothetical protein